MRISEARTKTFGPEKDLRKAREGTPDGTERLPDKSPNESNVQFTISEMRGREDAGTEAIRARLRVANGGTEGAIRSLQPRAGRETPVRLRLTKAPRALTLSP